MSRQKAYLETTIVSYGTAKLSRVLMIAAQQQYTQMWLERFAHHYDGYVSDLVVDEASEGDAEAAARRLEKLRGLAVLPVDQEARDLALALLKVGCIPAKAAADAMHVAVAAVNGMDYLVTWNCTHINNATMRQRIVACCAALGYRCPVICTPQELEVDDD